MYTFRKMRIKKKKKCLYVYAYKWSRKILRKCFLKINVVISNHDNVSIVANWQTGRAWYRGTDTTWRRGRMKCTLHRNLKLTKNSTRIITTGRMLMTFFLWLVFFFAMPWIYFWIHCTVVWNALLLFCIFNFCCVLTTLLCILSTRRRI